MFCRFCGENIEEGAKFCPECGGNLIMPAEQEMPTPVLQEIPTYYVSEKNRSTAMLLSLCFFMPGLQRFYVGKWKEGAAIVVVSFFICFSGSFINLYDLWQLYTESYRDVDGYPLMRTSTIQRNDYERRVPSCGPGFPAKMIGYCVASYVTFYIIIFFIGMILSYLLE